MSRDLFITPSTTKLDLFGGEEWIRVKEILSFGEQQRLMGAALKNIDLAALDLSPAQRERLLSGEPSAEQELGKVGVDLAALTIERFAIYITDWSFTRNGERADVSRAAIENLHPEVAREIDRALTEHVRAVEEKKVPNSGKPTGKTRSP